ncbi:hypothetical protein EW146_g2001 [Bondarzewia mesenterica]|uniref:Major facilitator superfamily (MFS) profile domain-containing protein n=1 Tax=Bondarzewia mesenterica TaxID=1095465 RepID=A0A4S4M235_9AGAM|nr:hypothetical protein EW146_g2001 [Bondarzewia mesenterica]
MTEKLDSTVNLIIGFSADAESSRQTLPPKRPPRDFRFWLVFLALGISTVLSALELSAVSTALPKIANDLHGSTFIWIGSAYALSATVLIPLSGGPAQNRHASLLLMAVGSALCGAATSMNFLIAGRAVQGLGSGGITSTTAIIVSDLVPLHERGLYNGLIGIAWSVASGVGPIVGGELAQADQWRWLFYLNIPICGVAAVLIFLFLRVRTPPGTLREKFDEMDWFGNALVIGFTTSCVIALTWSGIEHQWSSAPVLVPLILGLVGLAAFIAYEALIPKHPIVPFVLMSTFTSLSGYLQTFIMSIVLLGAIYYFPIYFQACKGASPVGAGVDLLGVALVLCPTGILSGVSVNKTRQYRPQLWISWVFLILGVGLFIPVSQNALALAFFMFLRNFGQVWGITIGGTILQNELRKRMPAQFLSEFPEGTAIAYATMPLISELSEPLKTEVRVAFADSLKVIWQVLVGVAGLGLLSSLMMKHLPLHTAVDKDWGLKENNGSDVPHELEVD